jgi:hypothetical protein
MNKKEVMGMCALHFRGFGIRSDMKSCLCASGRAPGLGAAVTG